MRIIYHERTPSRVLDVQSQTPVRPRRHGNTTFAPPPLNQDLLIGGTKMMATTTTTSRAENGTKTLVTFIFRSFRPLSLSTRRRGNYNHKRREERKIGHSVLSNFLGDADIDVLRQFCRLNRSTLDRRPIFRQYGGEWSDGNAIN